MNREIAKINSGTMIFKENKRLQIFDRGKKVKMSSKKVTWNHDRVGRCENVMIRNGRSDHWKRFFVLLVFVLILLPACGQTMQKEKETVYMNITAEQAKRIMDTETDYVILDVRTQEEYCQGHIPGAVLIPDYEIETKAEEVLKDRDQLILVYCRSGRRSKNAAQTLVELGYTKIMEFGGIIDWPYETECA